MTPKEKAMRLVRLITETIFDSGNTVSKPMVKDVATLCVDEIIETIRDEDAFGFGIQYWQNVKSEIEKL